MDAANDVALQGCVASLRSGMQLLESSITILNAGVSDYTRLTKVLTTTRHFELLPESSLLAAQSTLKAEIQPEITTLLNRVETYLDKLERREQSLKARADLQEGRLTQPTHSTPAVTRTPGPSGGERLGKLEEMKMHQLQAKKDRLSFAVQRLELEANERQRQLRKSMAAQWNRRLNP